MSHFLSRQNIASSCCSLKRVSHLRYSFPGWWHHWGGCGPFGKVLPGYWKYGPLGMMGPAGVGFLFRHDGTISAHAPTGMSAMPSLPRWTESHSKHAFCSIVFIALVIVMQAVPGCLGNPALSPSCSVPWFFS